MSAPDTRLPSTFSPGEAAERTGLTLDTLRYYEREGLVGPVDRTVGGQRQYTEDDIAWIGLLTCLRNAGLGIADLRSFTSLLRTEEAPVTEKGRIPQPLPDRPARAHEYDQTRSGGPRRQDRVLRG